MLFEANLYSSGGLADGYYCFEANTFKEAEEIAKERATDTVKRMFGSHYSGKIVLRSTIETIPFSWTREKEVS